MGTGGTWRAPALQGHMSVETARVPSPRGLKKSFHSHPWGCFNRTEVHPASGELDQLPLQSPASLYL